MARKPSPQERRGLERGKSVGPETTIEPEGGLPGRLREARGRKRAHRRDKAEAQHFGIGYSEQ